MRKTLKICLKIILFIAFAFGLFIAIIWSKEWTPDDIEPQSTGGLIADTIKIDTLKIVSWNIGYAGLGDDMDFFYDGGKSVQCSKERTEANLQSIVTFLKQHRDADFILLQEVDFDSKRSYHINEYEYIRAAIPEFMGWRGLNYVSTFVPIPLTDPIGSVKSGVVILSKYAPTEVLRLAYPRGFSFPIRLFNLKRCLLTASFKVSGRGNMLYINTTHNTAYDTGNMRKDELDFLRNYLKGKPLAITAGDWNCTPPGYTPSKAELEDPNFSPLPLYKEEFDASWQFLSDTGTYSTRYGYEPYNPKTTTRTILDFALLGSDIEPISAKTIELNYKNSDHNPVIFQIAIKR